MSLGIDRLHLSPDFWSITQSFINILKEWQIVLASFSDLCHLSLPIYCICLFSIWSYVLFPLTFFHIWFNHCLSSYYHCSHFLFWLLRSGWRTWIRPRPRSCVTILASVSWRGVSWSRCRSLGPVSGTSVCPPTRLSAQWASTASYSQRWVQEHTLHTHCW